MTLIEILIGFAITLLIIVGAVFFAFRTPNLKGLSQHGIGGSGESADGNQGFFSGSDGGGGGD